MGATRRLVAIFYADVAGYSHLTGADEEGTHRRVMALLDEVTERIKASGGDVLRYAGDAILAVFPSVILAVETSASIQTDIAERNAGQPEDERVEIRIGINIGDVIEDRGEVYGEGVNLAARLEAAAAPGGLCLSAAAHEQCRRKTGLAFRDGGEQAFKNIDGPVRVFHWEHGAAAGSPPPADAALPLPDKPSIAVLPFTTMSGDPEQEYFSDGITEDIITELSKISGLFVIARHSSFRFKGQAISLRHVGAELGVLYILEGSVRKAGARLRITAQLINAKTDSHVWGERFDRDLEDVFEVQDEVSRNVAQALSVVLSKDEERKLHKAAATSFETYDFFLRTRATLWPPTRENILNARQAYGRIVELDPEFAGGYAGYSMTFSFAVAFGHSSDKSADIRQALESAHRAIEADDRFAQAHASLALAHVFDGDFETAERLAGQAIDMQPGDADVHTCAAVVLSFACVFDKAHDAIATALRLDPEFIGGPHLNMLGIICFGGENYADAVAAFERNRARGGPIGVPALLIASASYAMLGQSEKAGATFRELLTYHPGFSVHEFSMLANYRNPEIRDRVIRAIETLS